jgi:hypothetical protein
LLKSFLESVEFALQPSFPDRDDFGLIQSKITNVIDSVSLERDAGGKVGSTFPHSALERGLA